MRGKKYTVTLSYSAHLPPAGIQALSKETVKAAKGKVSTIFQNEQKNKPCHVTLSCDELAERIRAGYCLRGALLEAASEKNTTVDEKGKRKYDTEKAFICQGAVLLDFDNKTDPPSPELSTADGMRDYVNGVIGSNAVSVISESWTSSEKLRKWHVVLLLSEPCSDLDKVKTVIHYLVDKLFKGLADTACKDPARYVLGSSPEKITMSYGGELDIDALYQKALDEKAKQEAERAKSAHKNTAAQSTNDTDMNPERLAEIILSSPCNFGVGGYERFRNTAAALYHVAHVSSADISNWAAGYDGTAQDPRTWEDMNRDNTFTVTMLQSAAKELDPTAYNTYKQEVYGKYRPRRPDPEPIPEQYAHLFDADRNLLFDELTGDDFIECEAIYSKILEFESSAEISTYIMRLKQAAKRFKLAGAVEERASAYKQEALRILRAERKAARREQTGQTERDLKNFPYIKMHETEQGDIYYKVSCPLLAEHIRQNCNYIITHERFSDHDRMFWYEGGVYKPITDSILQGKIKAYITAFDLNILRMADVKEVMTDLKTDMHFVNEEQLNNNEDIINFQNGLYSIPENKLLPHTPELYSTIQIPCNYDPNIEDCPPTFAKYLFELVDDDLKKANLLLEYMAACISNIYGFRTKKALFMYGRGNTGKSQLMALTEKMLGEENCAAGDLSNLEERFGTGVLYQKRLYGSGDMSFVSVQELKIFKNVTGGDDIQLEFKGKTPFPYKYKGFLWFCANELPSFGGDRGEWVYDRIIPFECKNVIPKAKQDKHLLDKMFAEREAIISVYLIPALQRLIANGYNFTLPNNVLDDLESYRDKNSPVRTFFRECCTMRDKQYTDGITLTALYAAFKSWNIANMNRGTGLSRKSFKRELAEILGMPNPDSLDVRRNDGVYIPVTLKNEAIRLYKSV